MPSFSLTETCAALGIERPPQAETVFSDVVTDTRKVKAGALFVALRGERFNGEDFARTAVQQGAAGVVVSDACAVDKVSDLAVPVLLVPDTLKAYQQLAHAWRERFTLPVIAITGSNGKTTTKDLTAAVLASRWQVLKTQANFNNEVGLPLTLLQLTERHEAAVVEIGMRGLGQIQAMAPIARPSIGIVTNVGETHMELLGSMENIARAKAELVEAIAPGGTVILNADNTYVAGMAAKARPGVRVVTFGVEKAADVRAGEIHATGLATHFSCTFAGGRYEFQIPLAGRHNVENALAAIAAGWVLGFNAADMQVGFAHFQPTGMRFECKKRGDYTIINDAYNASPMSMKAAIDTLAEIAPGRKAAVMGDMLELGSVSAAAHEAVGRTLAAAGVELLVTRGEMGERIADGAEAAGLKKVYRCASHEAAGEVLHREPQPGDTILFKGSRGMQMDKIIDLL